MPPGRRQRSAFSKVPWVPRASTVTSAPPPVSRLTSATTSTWVKSSATSAPMRLRHREADRVAVDADDERGAHQLRAGRGAQADRALGEDDDRVADLDAAGLRPAEAGRGDVGEQHDLLVGHAVGDVREVGLGRRDEQVLGLRAVDGVAEAPAADGLVAVAVAALAEVAGQAGSALAARRDRADEHALADLVAGHAGAELVDDAHRLVADDQARPDRVFALEDVDVGAADRRRRDADDGFAGAGVAGAGRPRRGCRRAVEDGRAHRAGIQMRRSARFGEGHSGPPFRIVGARGGSRRCAPGRPPPCRHPGRPPCASTKGQRSPRPGSGSGPSVNRGGRSPRDAGGSPSRGR